MADNTCVFCRIIKKDLPADIIYQTEEVTVFKDLYPQAPVHFLIIPNNHVDNIAALDDSETLGQLLMTVKQIAKNQGLSDYRVITNNGQKAGQTVFHLHFHLLGGWQGEATSHLYVC